VRANCAAALPRCRARVSSRPHADALSWLTRHAPRAAPSSARCSR
jgi:hypothetical protein